MDNNTTSTAAGNAAPIDLAVTVRPITPQGKLIGFATVTFGGVITVPDFRVFNGEKGLFVSNPSRPDGTANKGYRDTAFLQGDDIKGRLNVAARDAYVAEVEKLQSRVAAIKAPEPPRMKDQLEKAGQEAAQHNAGRGTPEQSRDKGTRDGR